MASPQDGNLYVADLGEFDLSVSSEELDIDEPTPALYPVIILIGK